MSNEPSQAAEIAGFLIRFAPFQGLEEGRLEELAEHVGLRTYPAGTEILVQAGEPASHLFLIRRGTVDLLDEGHVVDQLGQGELFGLSLFSGLGPVLTARARDETECYLIDPDQARIVMGSASGLAFLAGQSARWRERAVVEQHTLRAGIDDGVLGMIASARDASGLAEAAAKLPAMVAGLLERGVDPVDVGHTVGTTIDHLSIRLIELFVDERGDPPGAFAWVALGSAARHEQALTTDQDHAIAYGDGADPEAIDPYFADLAASVTEGLEACGIERCRGNVMAVNPALRRTRDEWRRRFGEYIAATDLQGARLTGIVFDYRRVTGAVDVEATLDDVIRSAGRDQDFLRRLARTVLESTPPVGRRGNIAVKRRGEHPGRIDVKHEGITIVTNLARIYAIVSGVTENRTIERLRRAATAGVITDRSRDDLVEAFRLLWRIRLERHAELMQGGERADDLVDPETLSPITARALGGSLRAIADAQDLLGAEFGIHRGR